MSIPVMAVISHALVIPVFRNRWRRLAEQGDIEVHLFIPEYWEQTWFSEPIIYETDEYHDGNFYIHPLKTTNNHDWNTYLLLGLDTQLSTIKPDIIYLIHEEGIHIHHQIYCYRKLFSPKSKIIFFSMNALGVRQKTEMQRLIWNGIRTETEAALVHYPGCMESLRRGGYVKPVFLQTQVGVDETLFKPNNIKRKQMRNKLNCNKKFVIGYVGRLTKDKGVNDLIGALSMLDEKIDWKLLLVGNGDYRERIEEIIIEKSWSNRVHITGFVHQHEVADYMNAMDCFILGSRTMPYWIDTFPLVTVQAQCTGVPVIASDSGSLPWQLSNTALIFPEGDREVLSKHILSYYENEKLRESLSRMGREHALQYFAHDKMNKNLKKIIKQVLDDSYLFHDDNEEYTQYKAYRI